MKGFIDKEDGFDGSRPPNLVDRIERLYMARSRDELKDIKRSIEDALGEIAELAKRLEKAKELLRAGNLKGAKDALKDILNYDVTRLEKTPWMKPRVEAIISTARQYYDQITQIEEQIERLSKA